MHGELEELSGLLRGELRIGGVYPTGPYDLFGMLADFRAAHPGVAIHMVESTQDDVLAGLRSDELDCAFAAIEPDALGGEFAATLLWQEEIVVALPLDHRLCARRRITLEELAAEELIVTATTRPCGVASSARWPSATWSPATRSCVPRWVRCEVLPAKDSGSP